MISVPYSGGLLTVNMTPSPGNTNPHLGIERFDIAIETSEGWIHRTGLIAAIDLPANIQVSDVSEAIKGEFVNFETNTSGAWTAIAPVGTHSKAVQNTCAIDNDLPQYQNVSSMSEQIECKPEDFVYPCVHGSRTGELFMEQRPCFGEAVVCCNPIIIEETFNNKFKVSEIKQCKVCPHRIIPQ